MAMIELVDYNTIYNTGSDAKKKTRRRKKSTTKSNISVEEAVVEESAPVEEAVVEESAPATENTASGDVSENKENEKKTEDSDKKES
jgi:large subunit ribosomal protein L17